ncbi:MAG: translation initiation factor IF-2 N-terminal domain-containing protein [Planctomycetota bacterium]
MAKKGIKVKELARELGVTSRQVIDRCRGAGLAIQNSITKLNPELERQVRRWFETTAPPDSSGESLER